MPVSLEARSPYTLFDDIEHAQEVLVLTYTSSLEFFERFALPDARALGARVTVISDATMVHADPMVVRRAGTQYLDARAVCPSGAFHPKLLVIAGHGQARVAIGSGNLTTAGWHGNAETWTVLRADEDGGPTTLRQVSQFLRALIPSPIALSPGANDALVRVADQLDVVPAEAPGPKLVTSLTDAIATQLPAVDRPVNELLMYSPFHDGQLAGTRALLDRFEPAQWTIYVREDTEVDGAKLETLVKDRGGRVAWISREMELDDGKLISDERYWHGKLVQWRTANGLWALTGSPNLSGPALLQSVADGGNCEIALLSRLDESLAPSEGDAPAGGIAMLKRPPGKPDQRPAGLLLAAIVRDGTVSLQLHAPLRLSGSVQRYDLTDDQWRTTASISAGYDQYTLDISSAPIGQAIRILLDGGAASNSVFVTDLARVRRPQVKGIGKVRGTPEEVARLGLGKQLLEDLDELRVHLLKAGVTVTRLEPPEPEVEADGGAAEPARAAGAATLEEFLQACDPVLGRRMTEFALVLPALPGVGAALDDTVGTLDTDDDDITPGDAAEMPPTVTDELNARTPDERARYRTFVERLISRSPNYPMVLRTLALRTLIHAIAAHLWSDAEWPVLLAAALRALGQGGDEPNDDERAAAASLASVGLALLRTDVPRFSRRDEHLIRYESTAIAVMSLFVHVDPERVEILAKELPARLAGGAGVLAAQRVVHETMHPLTGAQLAVHLLAEETGEEATVDDELTIVLMDPLPNVPEPTLIRVLGLIHDDGPVYVRGTTVDGRKTLAGWCAPLLAIEKIGPAGPNGRAWRLLKGQMPAMLDVTDLGRSDLAWMPNQPRPAEVDDVLGQLELGPQH